MFLYVRANGWDEPAMIALSQAMWIVTGASIIGTVANIKKYRWCFGVWLFTNTTWMLYDYHIGATAQAALFSVYVCLAIWGIYEWRITE